MEKQGEICDRAFSGCSRLISLDLPKGLTSIGNGAFSGSGIINFNLPDGLKTIGGIAFGSCLRLNSIEIPESVTDIGEYAFKSCNMSEIQLPKSLTSLKYGTFMSCSNLTTIRIPKAVTSIDTDAFKSCQALRSVYIENGATKIEKHAFGYNTDTEKKSNFVVIGQKNSTAEKYATENSFTFHNVTDPLKYYERMEATCESEGNKEYYVCSNCGRGFFDKDATKEIHDRSEIKIPATVHKWSSWKLVRTTSMEQTFQKGKSRPINILSDYMKMRTCASCGKQDWGQNLTYKLYINTDQVILKYGQSTTAVRASGFVSQI